MMTPIPFCTLRPIQAAAKMRSFRDNPMTMFEAITRCDTHAKLAYTCHRISPLCLCVVTAWREGRISYHFISFHSV